MAPRPPDRYGGPPWTRSLPVVFRDVDSSVPPLAPRPGWPPGSLSARRPPTPERTAAEAQSQSGHDMYRTASADPFLYENLLVNMDDLVGKLGKAGGGWYPFATESCQTKSGGEAD